MSVDYGKYFPISEYYKKVVVPLDSRFKKYKKDMFVCCLHDDTDPSFGIIHSKDGGEIYHCFGCNSWGNIIDLHKKVSRKYFKKIIDDNRAKIELCELFGISISDLPSEVEEISSSDKDVRKRVSMSEALNRFDISDYRYKLIDGKMGGKSIQYFNTLLIKMIDSYKE